MNKKEAGVIGGKISAINRREESLRKYYLNPTLCQRCSIVIKIKDGKKVADFRYNKYCSHSCSAKTTNIPRRKYFFCLFCNKALGYGLKYCNHSCHQKMSNKVFMKKWLEGETDGTIGKSRKKASSRIRNYLLQKYNNACQKCSWNTINSITKKCYLDVHHIDGNGNNNLENNLELLCPNCHSLTPNYKNTNGKERVNKSSRHWRRKDNNF